MRLSQALSDSALVRLRAKFAEGHPTAALPEIADHGLTTPAIETHRCTTLLTPRIARNSRVNDDCCGDRADSDQPGAAYQGMTPHSHESQGPTQTMHEHVSRQAATNHGDCIR